MTHFLGLLLIISTVVNVILAISLIGVLRGNKKAVTGGNVIAGVKEGIVSQVDKLNQTK